MNILHDWWPHITLALSGIYAWIQKEKVFNTLKWLLGRVMPDHINALDAHAKEDKFQFDAIRGEVKDSEVRIVEAMKENIGYLREDFRDYRASTDKRFDNQDQKFDRMEKTTQDLLFRYLDKKDRAS